MYNLEYGSSSVPTQQQITKAEVQNKQDKQKYKYNTIIPVNETQVSKYLSPTEFNEYKKLKEQIGGSKRNRRQNRKSKRTKKINKTHGKK